MTRRVWFVAFAIANVSVAAQVPEAWRHWQYWAVIELPGGAASPLVSAVVPVQVTAHARSNWDDLRVIDTDGREVPYVLHARDAARTSQPRPGRLLEPSVAPGQYTQAIVDTGAAPSQVHNAITLALDGTDDLLTWVQIAVSSDAAAWQIVRDRAPIYRMTQEGVGTQMHVTYPDSISRYLRIRVLDGSASHRIVAAETFYEMTSPVERQPAGLELAPSASGRQSSWTSPAGAPIPVSEVRFLTSQPAFYRPVRVETSDDSERWVSVAAGEIFRITDGGATRESLTVTFPEALGRRWRVTVFNQNDAPVADLRPELHAIPRRVVFRYEPGRQYRLLYGNSRASAPQYDLGQLTDVKSRESASAGAIGAEVTNRAYVDPAPWTERNQAVMWVALGVAVVAIGALAVRALRSAA